MWVDHVSAAWNRTERDFDSRAGFHHLFESMARARPDAPAISDGKRAFSYAQLSLESARLAAWLARHGAGPGAKVAILMERSIDLVLAMLSIAKTGAAYIPLDPAYPEQRLRDVIDDSGVTLVVTHHALRPRAQALTGGRGTCVLVDAHWPRIAACEPLAGAGRLDDGQLAYVIYTSGSTGQPKGVMIGHVALTNFLLSMAEMPGMTADDVLLAVTTHSFDISGLELLLPLMTGAQCCLCPADATADADRLLAVMERLKPTVMQATPATWTMLAHTGWTNASKMRILCGGEPLPDALKQFFDRTCTDVWNMYGPTETTIWSTAGKLEAGRPVSIGGPIANTRIYIVREDHALCDVGEPGELCIAGLGLAHGYLNKPDLSAEKFIRNPFEPDGRLYRTGDLAHWQPDGTIVHLGRIDNQVKIRGHRIEIGAIEAHLDSHPDVRQSVVVARRHSGGGQLVAYCVANAPAAGGALSADTLREWVAERLPAYMVPVFFIEIDEIPLTPAGKIDRKALEALPIKAAARSLAPAEGSGDIVRFVIEQWQRMLGVTDVAADTAFHDIGGDSVAANLFVTHLNRAFGCAVMVSDLKDCQSPAEIGRLVSELRGRDAQAPAGAGACGTPQERGIFAAPRQAQAARDARHDIAIVGMAGKFPGAETIDALWANIVAGRNSVSPITAERADLLATRAAGIGHGADASQGAGTRPVEWAGLIAGVFEFDPAFFRIAPREAELMDPQQRLMLLCVWRALEDAGIAPEVFRERRTGVFVAASQNEYALNAARLTGNKRYLVTGGTGSMIPNRISHTLDLFGPSECVETTCSSSLVALHRAVRAIRAGECEQAIVGGVSLLTSPEHFESYGAMGLLTDDPMTRTFQGDGRGYVRAEGLGVVILKTLAQAIADRDTIYAVVKGTSVNHGGSTASLTVPSPDGIAAAMCDAVADSGVMVDTLGYIEAHGTGSVAGDDVEVAALQSAIERLAGNRVARGAYGLGGLKPCIGHAEIASGMAALFKVVMAMRHGVLPGVPGVREEDLAARWPGSAFGIRAENRTWQPLTGHEGSVLPRRAGINSYGFGVNAHLIVEAFERAPAREREPAAAAQGPQVVQLSARTPGQLGQIASELRDWLRARPGCDLARVAHTLRVGRQTLRTRLALIVDSVDALVTRLEQAVAALTPGGRESVEALAAIEGVLYSASSRAESRTPSLESAERSPLADPLAYARAWAAGERVPVPSLADGPARLSLPGYPFQLGEYRIQAGENGSQTAPRAPDAGHHANGLVPAAGASSIAALAAAGAPRARRICVIGGGPGGLVMAKSLLEEGHQPIVYEASAKLGGVWNLEHTKTVGTYSTTRFQNSKDTSFFSDFYPDTATGMFPSVREVRAYLEAYADRFDLARHIRCGVTVTAVREAGACWEVDSVTADGERRTETFDGVALCHGRYRIAQRLSIPGLDRFPGQVLHAGQYYDSAPFAGKRVLVIGNGVSGMDIATEASKVADSVVWSIRSRKFILPRMVGFLPNDFVSPANLLLPELMRARRNLDRLARALPAFDDAFMKSGMRPSLAEFRAHPFIHVNDEVVDLVAAGRIQTVFREVERFEGNACYHRGNDVPIEDIDVVVECSGYRTDAMWHYVEGIEPQRDFALGLFHRRNPMLVNQYGLQEIGVIGTFPYLEMVARWYAQIVSGKYTLSESELAERADTRQIVMAPLASVVIGAKLGLVPDPRVEFKAFWQLLSRPCFPAQYRLRGPHACADAPAIVRACSQRAFVDGEAQDPELRRLKLRLLAGLGADALRGLYGSGEITQQEYEGALARLDDPLVVDWRSQFLTPTRDSTAPVRAVADLATQAADTDSDSDAALRREYRALIDKLKRRTIDADDLLLELQKLSRVS